MSDKNSNLAYPHSPCPISPRSPIGQDFSRTGETATNGSKESPTTGSKESPGHTDEITRITALLDNHQKQVNGQMDECRHFVTSSLDKIMDVLDKKMELPASSAEAAAHQQRLNQSC
jgi:hypothetical protein